MTYIDFLNHRFNDLSNKYKHAVNKTAAFNALQQLSLCIDTMLDYNRTNTIDENNILTLLWKQGNK